ncbi:Thiol-specific monooxygenase [Colletotrichum higginsianum IMI 349063]|uniref:Thiol-specific monooxygenase n=1 Tax=Colletotrichum higginsianum (strain IMI 349063) TaxID=759273 RepID=A0A1B7XUF9_COLHI|nr:Thiol-specific monooxygenase [Colletotrichum higginsianum IMI 349063]OBR03378.1 Thiol-specific monooxygenase [Colletotrichum higginsianum IMI 349063]
MKPAKRVAVIGLGPAGAIAIDALAQEQAFDTVRVFERREAPGGCWYRAEKVRRVPNSAAAAAGGGEGEVEEKEGKEDQDKEAEEEWKLTLRQSDPASSTDSWWEERFDALVVASGHYSVPYIPPTPGLAAFAASRPPGSVIHSKHYRGRAAYLGRTVVVVGASVSAADIATDLAAVAREPVTAVVLGHTPNGYFGAEAFEHPLVRKAPSIARVDAASRTVHFVDGSSVSGVDDIIFGTGYTWTLPFFDNPPPSLPPRPGKETAAAAPLPTPRNNRIPNLYLHTIYTPDPTILFVGAVNAGLTFKVFEYQAVLAARLLAGRVPPDRLPDAEAQRAWEADRVASRGDGPRFALVFPDFPDYFETLRRLAGPPTDDGKGRRLPPYNPFWFERFMAGHERRKAMWRRLNAEAREALGGEPRDGGQGDVARAKL